MSNILSYTISSEHECFEQVMLYEHLFLIISYTWRNSYFFNNIGALPSVAPMPARFSFTNHCGHSALTA